MIFPDDPRFFNPPSMLERDSRATRRERSERAGRAAAVAKMILDSLALRYASVLRAIETLTGEDQGVQIVGGGSRNEYLNQATATATGLPVLAGPWRQR